MHFHDKKKLCKYLENFLMKAEDYQSESYYQSGNSEVDWEQFYRFGECPPIEKYICSISNLIYLDKKQEKKNLLVYWSIRFQDLVGLYRLQMRGLYDLVVVVAKAVGEH